MARGDSHLSLAVTFSSLLTTSNCGTRSKFSIFRFNKIYCDTVSPSALKLCINFGCGTRKCPQILIYCIRISLSTFSVPPSGDMRTQKLKSHLLRTQRFKVLPLKPEVGQCIAISAMLTDRDFFVARFYPSGLLTCIFSRTSREFFPCWLWLTSVPF